MGLEPKGSKRGAPMLLSPGPHHLYDAPLVNNRLRKELGEGHFPLQEQHYMKEKWVSENRSNVASILQAQEEQKASRA